MQALIIPILKFLLPMMIDLIIKICQDLVKDSTNTVDDHIIEVLTSNKQIIIEASKKI